MGYGIRKTLTLKNLLNLFGQSLNQKAVFYLTNLRFMIKQTIKLKSIHWKIKLTIQKKQITFNHDL